MQRWAAQAKVVKAWNIVGNPHMFQPSFPGGPPDMFIAGNDADAKVKVSEILAAFGWQVVDLGSIEMSRYLEPLAMVWIMTYFRTKSGNHAIKLLRSNGRRPGWRSTRPRPGDYFQVDRRGAFGFACRHVSTLFSRSLRRSARCQRLPFEPWLGVGRDPDIRPFLARGVTPTP